jgi:Kef-type K+ transport system membrane component KefB
VSLILLGVLLGPSISDLLPAAWNDHGPWLSRAAFCLLLLRAGIAFDSAMLRRVVRHSIGFGTIPVAAELIVVTLLSRLLFFESWTVALLGGFLVAAVSPAVVLPTMLAVKERGLDAHAVPDRIMGQTIVNSFIAQTGILILISALTPAINGVGVGQQLLTFPVCLVGGLVVGMLVGSVAPISQTEVRLNSGRKGDYLNTLTGVTCAMLVYFICGAIGLENVFATIAVGVMLRHRIGNALGSMQSDLAKLWKWAEIVLFVSLGSVIDLGSISGGTLVISLIGVIVAALAVRALTAYGLSLLAELTTSERIYLAYSNLPKATIQAVFGAAPLIAFTAHGDAELIGYGQTLLIMAVLAIIVTAPVGAVLLENTADHLLDKPAKESK